MGASKDFSAGDRLVMTDVYSSFSGQEFTFATWMLLRAYDTFGCVIWGTNTGTAWYCQLITDTEVAVGGTAVTVTSTDFDDDTWRFVAFRMTASVTSFVHGTSSTALSELGTAGAPNSMASGNKTFYMGDWHGGAGGNFRVDGLLAHAQFWNRNLSLAELEEARWKPGSVASGLIGYWTGMEGANDEPDRSGNGAAGVNSGASDSSNGPPVSLGTGLIRPVRASAAAPPAGGFRSRIAGGFVVAGILLAFLLGVL